MKNSLLLLIAAFGLLVPNGLFLYALFDAYHDVAQLTHNALALAFMIDALMAMVLLAYYFAWRPIGHVSWYWFIFLSFIGGLGFSLPFYWWLNKRVPE